VNAFDLIGWVLIGSLALIIASIAVGVAIVIVRAALPTQPKDGDKS
jgi:hypothetical protein